MDRSAVKSTPADSVVVAIEAEDDPMRVKRLSAAISLSIVDMGGEEEGDR